MRLAGTMPAAPHVLGERRHRQLLGDLRLADERAAAVPPHEQPFADEVVERRAHGEARHAEVAAAAGARTGSRRPRRAARSGRARWLRVSLCFVTVRFTSPGPCIVFVVRRTWYSCDQVVKTTRRSHGGTLERPAPASAPYDRSAEPSSTSKKWNPAGSTASATGSPCRAPVRGSTRAVKSVVSRREQRRVLGLASRGRHRGRRASTRKNTCVSAPSSSSTSTSTSSRGSCGSANAASSNASGRMPSTTRPASRGRRSGSSGSTWPPTRTTVAVDRRLDEVHRRRADERGDEDVPRPS